MQMAFSNEKVVGNYYDVQTRSVRSPKLLSTVIRILSTVNRVNFANIR